ncbi:MAG: pilus assembly protein [Actinobacteria bacterium]|nr:pilus assembly protein [Actinomycetota bacterium]
MFMVRHHLHRRRERGAAAVEFALVMPVLVMIMFGIMEFGYAFFIQSSVAGAARVGVRNYAINWSTTGYTTAQLQQQAIQLADQATPDPTKVASATISVAVPPATPVAGAPCTPGAQTTLVLKYQYHSLTGLLDGVLGSNITLTGKASMACGG